MLAFVNPCRNWLFFVCCAISIAGRCSTRITAQLRLSTSVINTQPLAETVHLVTCSNILNETRVQLLLKRAQTLGYTTHWLNCSDAFVHNSNKLWGKRLEKYQKFVEDIPGDPLVSFVDSFDTLAEGPASEAAARFEEYEVPLVFSCVYYAYPSECAAYKTNPPLGEGHCQYPSGGAYMGRASGFRNLFQNGGSYTPETDDQCWVYSALAKHFQAGSEYKLDHRSRLFLSYTSQIAWDFAYALDQGRHVFAVPGLDSRPTFIHLDSSHVDQETMEQLQACEIGSEAPSCNQSRAGWWPDPASKKFLKRVVMRITACLILLIAVGSMVAIHRTFNKNGSHTVMQ